MLKGFNIICASFIYNRVDDACFIIIYDKKVEEPNCDIHSGVPQDNPSDCINPEDKCEVSSILHRHHVWRSHDPTLVKTFFITWKKDATFRSPSCMAIS